MFAVDADHRFTFVNRFALRVWNRHADELLGNTFKEGLPFQPSQDIIAMFRFAVRAQVRYEFESSGFPQGGGRVGIILYPCEGGLLVYCRPLSRSLPTDKSVLEASTDGLRGPSCLAAAHHLDLPGVQDRPNLNDAQHRLTQWDHSAADRPFPEVVRELSAGRATGAVVCRWNGKDVLVVAQGEQTAALQELLERVQADLASAAPESQTLSMRATAWSNNAPSEVTPAPANKPVQHQNAPPRHAASGEGEAETPSLVAFSRHLETLQTPNDMITHTLDYLLTQLGIDYALYAEWKEKKATVTQQVVRPGLPALDALLSVQTLLSSLFPAVQRTRQTVWQTNVSSSIGILSGTSDQQVDSALLTPVLYKGHVVGGLLLLSVDADQRVTPGMRQVAELVALHLEHALEFRRIADEDRLILDSRLLTFGIALEARDPETYRHTQRTARMAVQFGRHLGFHDLDLDHLRQSAYLHDLGKLSIPDAILQSAARLTPEEWSVMQTHTTRGWELASQIPGLSPEVLNAIRHHHEHWDGSGYPDGLAGTRIPLLARVVTICDVYDALVNERPYKAAWSVEATLQEIQAQSGRLFDPEIVRAFLAFKRS